MLFSRPRRNRYRRRPSRLTALGKAVVAGTATAFLAIGWASQASRSPEPPQRVPELGVADRPVSAPPRWPVVPAFGGLDGAPAAEDAARSDVPPAPVPPPGSPATQPPAAPLAGASAPLGVTPAELPALVSLLDVPPTSRTRFEQAHIGGRPRLAEWLDVREGALPGFAAEDGVVDVAGGRVRVEYSLDEKLTREVFEILRRGRVERGVAIVIDPRTGRLLAYAATDSNVLPVERAYPAASIIKVVTAAAMLERRPDPTAWDCVYEGNKYRLTERRLDRPARGNHSTLEEALATSNNQCFSQWAIHGLGEPRLRRMLDLFGWTGRPALGHAEGRVDGAATRYDLGQLGSGLDGARVTPLHVASLASVLTDGRLVEPRWIDRVVDAQDRVVALPEPALPRRVINPSTAENLRELMVATTKRGTARRAFRTRRGIPLLGNLEVAGKTGNLNGSNPSGRYEWFFGVAPADDPKIGVVVLQVHGHLWWARSSELAANILRTVFCEGSSCRAGLATRFTGLPRAARSPVLVTDLEESSTASTPRE
jgi:penicillin-binding protein A